MYVSINYFPYIAIGLVVILGYWYINGLISSIRELESKNASLQTEVRILSESIQDMRKKYVATVKMYSDYTSNINNLQSKVTVVATNLAKSEKRIDTLVKAHPQLVEKSVNAAVAKRFACIVSASKGSKQAVINGVKQDCDP